MDPDLTGIFKMTCNCGREGTFKYNEAYNEINILLKKYNMEGM